MEYTIIIFFTVRLYPVAFNAQMEKSIPCQEKETKCDGSGPLLNFLRRKAAAKKNLELEDSSKQCSSVSTVDEFESQTPKFTFVSYSIKDSVEYDVVMTIFSSYNGHITSTSHNFKTRYSKLLKLHQSLDSGNSCFPSKKIFGSKSTSFLNKRMSELQQYLNEMSKQRSPGFQKFIQQIQNMPLSVCIRI